MSMTVPTTAPTAGTKPYLLTVRQFERMIDAGILPETDNVELLGGIIVKKMVKHPPHSSAIRALSEALRRLIPDGYFVSEEKPVLLGEHWYPEPDLAVIPGPLDRYDFVDPGVEEIALLVEVAESSYATDRGAKWQGYAAHGIRSYWIVNLSTRCVEVYTDPAGQGDEANFRSSRFFGIDEEIPVTIDGRDAGRITTRNILPAILP